MFQQTKQEGAAVPQLDPFTPRTRGRRVATWAAVAAVAMLALSGCELGDVSDGFLPRGVTENAERVRSLWIGAWIAALLVGALVWGLILWCVVAYRRRRDDNELPVQLRYNVPLEILYTIVPIFMVAVFFFYTARDQSALLDTSKDPAVTVNVVGKQWSWDFNYVEGDVHETGTQAILTGEPGAEETIPTLYLPVGERVEFVLTARDVIHSFWVPQFLQKLDMIPGKVNKFQVVPTEEGTFRGKCAELCGAYHSQMLFNVKVVPRAEFDAHLADLESRGQTGMLGTDLNREGSGLVPGEDEKLPEELRN
ncbi:MULTISPECIES: cytochrome c oxidase subunit II [unclassified Knoellia]|uniref:aa3-type cytochrome oxidase subunit II n=1 Tax=Knoellia altitudinis TaxID=3404795 RepID=UPI00361D847D